jgi:sugar lactone lactonase YvrE
MTDMAEQLTAELLVDAKAVLGEGPVWDHREGVLWWPDIYARQLHRYDPATDTDRVVDTEREVGALVPRAGGGMLLAMRGGFAAYDGETEPELLLPLLDDRPDLRLNDGKCDAAGRFYVSTMAFSADVPVGSLWRLDPDWTLHEMLGGLTIGNGLGWSPDGRTLYFIDSPTQRIDAFTVDVASGDLVDRRTVVTVPEDQGMPDGMCVDAEGALWVALFGGGAVHRYSPEGELLARVSLPVSNVTCASFGGPGLDELFVTTASAHLDDGERAAQPEAGGLFRVRPGVTGSLPQPFRG